MWMSHYKLEGHELKLLEMTDGEFDHYMCITYPAMFQDRTKSPKETCMHWGFSIGRGWRHVLDSACKKLLVIEKTTKIVCVFDQIKEKFGTARFYCHSVFPEDVKMSDADWAGWESIIDGIVNQAEAYTECVCEYLGTNYEAKDSVVSTGWIYGMSFEGFKAWTRSQQNAETAETIISERQKMYDARAVRIQLVDMLNSIDSEEELPKVIEFLTKTSGRELIIDKLEKKNKISS